MERMSRIMEIIWIILSVICLGIGFYSTYQSGFAVSYMFFVLALLALVMFWMRRFRRLKEKKEING